ncbi:MAG: division/cell wall cluster transcriptional repressor MraZ [Lachnospiraceae bacterium]|nr:division/cell wall cluster transcriptional repressor MraZ [Lachnospiraceae bacterium]MBO7632287.1 division/cell wall cluster transcriptional repressor MraZ [Lachnospiraceae bacterium]
MNKLAGKFEHSIDAKGRMIVPSKFREDLGDSFVATLGLDGCLYLFSDAGWEKFTSQLETLPGTKDHRRAKRYFMANAASCDIDKQGRTLVPAALREQAGIDKDVVLVGMIDKIEMWSKDRFEALDSFESVDEIVESLTGFGINF